MITKSTMDKKALKRWDTLLEAYFNNPTMSELWRSKVLQLLFLEEPFQNEKFTALEKIFNKFFDSHCTVAILKDSKDLRDLSIPKVPQKTQKSLQSPKSLKSLQSLKLPRNQQQTK